MDGGVSGIEMEQYVHYSATTRNLLCLLPVDMIGEAYWFNLLSGK